MIVKIKNKTLLISVPAKCGITTVTNILGFDTLGVQSSKTKIRNILKKQNKLLHIGGPDEISWVKENNVHTDLKIAVYRDPIERVISSYYDKVHTKKGTYDGKNNDFNYVYENFNNLIKQDSIIGRHFHKQIDYFHNDVDFFDKIILTKDINNILKPMVEKIIKKEIPNFKTNVSVKPFDINLTDDQMNFFKNYYKEDYDFFENSKEKGLWQSI